MFRKMLALVPHEILSDVCLSALNALCIFVTASINQIGVFNVRTLMAHFKLLFIVVPIHILCNKSIENLQKYGPYFSYAERAAVKIKRFRHIFRIISES